MMKLTFIKKASFVLLAAILFAFCQKELSCEGCQDNIQPPLALAGPDGVITLPTDSVLLDGSSSSDPDGKISEWQWTKIEGPASFTIINTTAAKTAVKNLRAGIYQFELLVKDDDGLSAKDTVQVVVDSVPGANHPPLADAGPDTTILLPLNTALLDGSRSADPDNNITAYQWTTIAGPATANIAAPTAVQTQVANLAEGTYQFELKVTDAGGLFSKDTVQLAVVAGVAPSSCGSSRPEFFLTVTPFVTGRLSKPRAIGSIVAAGSKILFAGGTGSSSGMQSWGETRVDIYDMATNTWSIAELSEARYQMAGIAAGNKIFFAGGSSGEIGDVTHRSHAAVDIYDLSTNTWSATIMSEAKAGMAAGTVGNKVLFAGGVGTLTVGNTTYFGHIKNKVEMYDLLTGEWSVFTLREAKTNISAVTLNNKIYFAGGVMSFNHSSMIDIYDNATDTWSVSSLSEPKVVEGISAGNNIYYTGGFNERRALCTVEIKDVAAQTTSFDSLSDATYTRPFIKDNKLICPQRNRRFDIYDLNTNTWSVAVLPAGTPLGNIVFLNNTIYMAGEYEKDANGNATSVIINKLNF